MSALDQPMPEAASRRKKGRGTSNHRSLEPNRKTRERESTLMLWVLLRGAWGTAGGGGVSGAGRGRQVTAGCANRVGSSE